MEKINHFIELTRVKKPIGFMLLFWPCLWGLTIAFDFSNNTDIFFKYCFLFLCGSILMRSAGCIINDIVDKDFDSKVERTKKKTNSFGQNFSRTWYNLLSNTLPDCFNCITSI